MRYVPGESGGSKDSDPLEVAERHLKRAKFWLVLAVIFGCISAVGQIVSIVIRLTH